MRPGDERYFERIEQRLERAIDVASRARERGEDPVPDVEIPVARDMADRVEKVLDIPGVADRVRELEGEMSREEAALELARDFAEGRVGSDETPAGKVEAAVRTAVALLTEGVVAAPIEGIDRVELVENDDGTEAVRVFYAGPIRSAGGTAQALSVLVADYTRALVGLDAYEPREEEVQRYVEELTLYDEETGLQYAPKDAETEFIARNCPVMLDGEATGGEEVSGYRDLERIDTNSPRGGLCLVLGEGIAQKAPKIQRYTEELSEVDWPWLDDLIGGTGGTGGTDGDGGVVGEDGDGTESGDGVQGGDGTESGDGVQGGDGTESGDGVQGGDGDVEADPLDRTPPADGVSESDPVDGTSAVGSSPRPESDGKFLEDLIAGRPVFGYPSEPGGFRLRYGRARNHGFATAGVHPATMHLLNDALATGTQLKTERPGKAAGVVPVDSVDGPTVRLANGDVRRIDDPETAVEVRNGVDEILDLGEYLVNYGEFVENNRPLAPASYVVEWWTEELAAEGVDVQALRDARSVDLRDPDAEQALNWALETGAPLHPSYTYLWHDLTVEEFVDLAGAVATGRWADGGPSGKTATCEDTAATDDTVATDNTAAADNTAATGTLVVPRSETVCEALETLLIEHRQGEETVRIPDALVLVRSLGLPADLERSWTIEDLSPAAREWDDGENAIRAVNEVAPFAVRERAPTRVGTRMGRPEKSEKREMSPPVHTLFPLGEAGGDQRDVTDATRHSESMRDTPGEVDVQLGRRSCRDCDTETFRTRCPDCGDVTDPAYACPDCRDPVEPDGSGEAVCPRCETEARTAETYTVDVHGEYRDALERVGERESAFDVLKGVKGLSSEHKVPEPLAKGVLRAKNGVSVFKDGTVRYDMTDLPVTSVRPAELGVSAEQFRELGYETDVHGEPLERDDQLVELKVQDVVLSEDAAEHMLATGNFVDDLMAQYYELEPFYQFEDREDLVGELVLGMAPHTSAAVVGRVVGFTTAAVGYAHPYFHAAKRRNCFQPETKVWHEDEHGAWHYAPIRSVVEERIDDPRTDDFGTKIQELDEAIYVPSITDSGELVRKPVDAVSKHPAPDHLVRIEARSGREITVTPDHEMHVADGHCVDGHKIGTKRASDLTETDELVEPSHLDVVDSADRVPEFDLLREFLATDTVDNDRLMVKGIDKDRLYDLFESALKDGWDGPFYPLKSTAECLNLSKKGLSNHVYRESIPVSLLLDVFGSIDELVEQVPDDVSLGMKRDSPEIDRYIEVTDRVATLLGYYAAEGFAREQETSKGRIHQTTICGTETEARDFYVSVFREAFGVEPYRENEAKVTVSGRLLRTFFDTVLDAGVSAETKRVPQCIFDAPRETVEAYLRGYFSGDGSVEVDRLTISATTVSRELKEDVFALLTRIGISARTEILEPILLREKFPDYYLADDDSRSATRYVLHVTSKDAVTFSETVGFQLSRKHDKLESQVAAIAPSARRVFDDRNDNYVLDEVASVTYVEAAVDSTYCLTVADTNSLVANDMSTLQCDGDEDCVMLLLDGLLNFSQSYLPDNRGGRMDAPLVMSSRIDPTEIDDEAHKVDVVDSYPRELYEATRRMADPGEVDLDVELAEASLGTDGQYAGFRHTHDTTDIAAGPELSAYKTLEDMDTKMEAQLELARTLRAVDEADVAERVIEYHFLPDLMGNLRAFSRQETRCKDCGRKFRRPPLSGNCRECGGEMSLTVYEGSVNKYLETSMTVAEEYGASEYTKQRLEILEHSLESIFKNDKNKQSGIADFM